MKRIPFCILSICYLVLVMLGLLICVKPGASIFYQKIPIQSQNISALGNCFQSQVDVSNKIISSTNLLLLEDQKTLSTATIGIVRAGESGTYISLGTDSGKLSFLFNPYSASNPAENGHTYWVYIRPVFISRTWGAILFSALFLGFMLISLINPVNRKIVTSSPIGILRIWIDGTAGQTIFEFMQKLFVKLFGRKKELAEKLRNVNYLFQNVFFPLALLAFFCGSYIFFSSRFQLQGITYHFLSTLFICTVILLVILGLAYLVFRKYLVGGQLSLTKTHNKLIPSDLILLLLPMTPVVQYVIRNLNIISITDCISVLLFFSFFSFLVVLGIPWLLRNFCSMRILILMGTTFAFIVTNMASISSGLNWYEKGNFWIQLCLLAVIYLLIRVVDKQILYIFIVINFIINSAFQVIPNKSADEESSVSMEEINLKNVIRNKLPSSTPNIYLLVYDAYSHNETLLDLGFDNTDQENFLTDMGFVNYPNTYSIAASTLSTMSRVLEISARLDYPRKAVSGDGVVQNLLKKYGYTSWGIFSSDYMFRGTSSSYDFFIPDDESKSYLIEGIILGEFKFDIGFETKPHEEFVSDKNQIFENLSKDKVFVYMHTNYPGHSQFSGSCRPNEYDLFINRLKKANSEMRRDIEIIINNDPGAIVIVAGDHGPYLTKNCASTEAYEISEITRADIQNRFGTFLAIRWPTQDFEQYDDITIIQDIFPVVFAYIFQDETILDTKIDSTTLYTTKISGVYVENGIIHGGNNDGEPLFLTGK